MKEGIDSYTNFLKRFKFIPPFIGKKYNKYKILIIGQNRLGDKDYCGHNYGKYKNHTDFNKLFVEGFLSNKISNNVLKKPFDLLSRILNVSKMDILNYIAFVNLIKTPSKSNTDKSELSRLFDKEPKYNRKKLVLYEIEEILKPSVILVLGRQTMDLFFDKVMEVEEDPQLEYLLYYKKIPLIEFYHPSSRGKWSKDINKLDEKIKRIMEIIKV